ncbi:hypothetical protein BT69DRAFT_1287838, partial [Atractiella rhizophila]
MHALLTGGQNEVDVASIHQLNDVRDPPQVTIKLQCLHTTAASCPHLSTTTT